MNALELKKLRDSSGVVVPHNVLVYGAAKTGKTLDTLKLAEHYKILYLDGEKGGDVMMQLDDKLLANIEWVRFGDSRKSPVFIEAMMRFFEGRLSKYVILTAHSTALTVCCGIRRECGSTRLVTTLHPSGLLSATL